MDPTVAELMAALIADNSKFSQQHLQNIAGNLFQMGGVILETVVQSNATVSDDSALFAALNTASRIPASGAIDTGA